MNLWKQLKSLDLAAILALAGLCLKHPLWVVPTIRATRKCVAVCDEHLGKRHHRNTPANAFRHALWNYYIARACYTRKVRMEQALEWAEKITDWHEDFSKNSSIARQMDLHNNRVGRLLFKQDPDIKATALLEILKSKMADSQKVKATEDLEHLAPIRFVHLIDPIPQ